MKKCCFCIDWSTRWNRIGYCKFWEFINVCEKILVGSTENVNMKNFSWIIRNRSCPYFRTRWFPLIFAFKTYLAILYYGLKQTGPFRKEVLWTDLFQIPLQIAVCSVVFISYYLTLVICMSMTIFWVWMNFTPFIRSCISAKTVKSEWMALVELKFITPLRISIKESTDLKFMEWREYFQRIWLLFYMNWTLCTK